MIKKLLLSTVFIRAPLAFMTDTCPVVGVKGDDGELLYINKSDYDAEPKKYKLFKGETKDGSIPSDSATTTEIDEETGEAKTDEQLADEAALRERIEKIEFGVIPDGRKFFIVDSKDVDETGKPKIINDMEGVDPNGYKSSKAAWDAAFLLKSQNTGNPAGVQTGGMTTPQE